MEADDGGAGEDGGAGAGAGGGGASLGEGGGEGGGSGVTVTVSVDGGGGGGGGGVEGGVLSSCTGEVEVVGFVVVDVLGGADTFDVRVTTSDTDVTSATAARMATTPTTHGHLGVARRPS